MTCRIVHLVKWCCMMMPMLFHLVLKLFFSCIIDDDRPKRSSIAQFLIQSFRPEILFYLDLSHSMFIWTGMNLLNLLRRFHDLASVFRTTNWFCVTSHLCRQSHLLVWTSMILMLLSISLLLTTLAIILEHRMVKGAYMLHGLNSSIGFCLGKALWHSCSIFRLCMLSLQMPVYK